MNPDSLGDDELRTYIDKYVTRHTLITDEERRANACHFDMFLQALDDEINEMRRRSEVPYAIECKDKYTDHIAPQIIQLVRWLDELTVEIFSCQLCGLSRLATVARALQNYVVENKGTVCQVTPLNTDIRQKIFKSRRYKSLRRHRRILIIRINRTIGKNRAPDPIIAVQKEVLAAVARFDPETRYSPPSAFDDHVAAYLCGSPDLCVAVLPVAALVAAGAVDSLLEALSDLSLRLMKSLHVSAGATRSVIYISLVRYIFSVAYSMNPTQLMGSQEESARFLIYCDLFAHQKVRDLVLSDAITKNFTPGLGIASLFRSKQVEMLAPMEFLTNPIDLMNYMHKSLGALAQYFGSGTEDMFLSFDDTMSLFLALMSLTPPANALGIADYVNLWEPVQIAGVLSVTKNYFVCAVEQIQAFGRERLKEKT